MDWLRFWRTPNPTSAWLEDTTVPLVVDLDEHRFSGVVVGDPIERLSFLGPGIITPCGIAWPEKGFDLTTDEGSVGEMSFHFLQFLEDEPRDGLREFAGLFRYRGARLRLDGTFTESDASSRFGEPYWCDEGESEIILFDEFIGREWQLEFTVDGFLKCMVIGTPVLERPEQRAAYGVTKPWPPDFR